MKFWFLRLKYQSATFFFLTDGNLPTMISLCADAIIKAESASKKRELEEAAGTWDGKSNDCYHHKIFGIIFSDTHKLNSLHNYLNILSFKGNNLLFRSMQRIWNN